MNSPSLKHDPITIRQLIGEFRAGRVVVPEFQRDYVWPKNRAPRLIDSLYRGFPISSLLLWSSSDDVTARRREPRPIRTGSISWLIDGQQRVITLARTMSGDEGIDVVFNPEREEFQLANAATRNDRNWFRLADIWDDGLYLEMRRALSDSPNHTIKREEKFENVRRILDYNVPTVLMVNHSFDQAVEAFSRINTLGVKLKAQDIQSAKIAARHSGFISESVAPFLDDLKRQGFGRLNVMQLFRACAFVAKPDGRNRTPLHELDERDVERAWNRTKRATGQAIGLIRSELGLVNMDVLWSGSFLVPLIALCDKLPARERNSKELIGWLSLAALLHRYSGSSETALDEDLRACRASDPIGSLLGNLRKLRPSLQAEENDFSGAVNDRSGLLCVYIACMNRDIRDFFSGGKVVMQSGIDRHHILPRAQFERNDRSKADNLANIAFITERVNKSIGVPGPEVYLPKIDESVLKSQCVPLDKKIWKVDEAAKFWSERRKMLATSFNEVTRNALPQRRKRA